MPGARLDVWATRLQLLWHTGYYGSCCRFYITSLIVTVPATNASGSYTRKHPGAPLGLLSKTSTAIFTMWLLWSVSLPIITSADLKSYGSVSARLSPPGPQPTTPQNTQRKQEEVGTPRPALGWGEAHSAVWLLNSGPQAFRGLVQFLWNPAQKIAATHPTRGNKETVIEPHNRPPCMDH